MDPNLLYWKTHGQTFSSRLNIWCGLLDPLTMSYSNEEIRKAYSLFRSGGILKKEDEYAIRLSLSSVHSDSGRIILAPFRPAGLCLLSMVPVAASFLPLRRVTEAIYWQLLQRIPLAGFTYSNRNSSGERRRTVSQDELLVMAGTVSFTTFAGALPLFIINRLGVRSTGPLIFFRSVLPIPLAAALASFSVLAIRNRETETGIKVFDSNGNLVGLSKAAGAKAVKETALSRAVLFATSLSVPRLLVLFLNQIRFFQRKPKLVTFLQTMTAVMGLGLMIPVSFSLFPQLGTIKKEHVEEKLKAAAEDGQLYYYRGV